MRRDEQQSRGLSETAVRAIERTLDDAMSKTVEYVVPYFREVAEEYGVEYAS